MKHISTTATAVQKLNRSAKNLRKETRTSLAIALDSVAKSAGYDNWKHVTVCLEQTRSKPIEKALPKALAEFLQKQRQQTPPAKESIAAMLSGMVFALDIKDTERTVIPSDILENESIWLLTAADIWKTVFSADDELAKEDANQSNAEQELISRAFDVLVNFKFFVYVADSIPATVEEAYIRIFKDFPHPPTYIWLQGKFINMEDAHEIRLDGEVLYSSDGEGIVSYQSPGYQDGGTSPTGWEAPAAGMQPFIPRLDISKIESGFYEYVVHYGGQEMCREVGCRSISEAIIEVSDITGIDGYEIGYEGITVGTYPIGIIKNSAEKIAREARATVASFK
ncbi:hypothetical protein [Oxalicibacterium faecigallinarum]|uniref:Uncharacterized protein n=1 Tax=Oxalicibacterium faecigallinarum TaxID=573741 RepID=A0A8J3AVG0_9BURK|nr:hypothetical protein [Oxalicibacterium faecigallinarum]GGI17612.1 hypothetical protein GCM10008066_09850 [Oxalicibacterium faecigallinarum]